MSRGCHPRWVMPLAVPVRSSTCNCSCGRRYPGGTSMVIADVSLGDLLLTTLEIFFLIMLIWVFIAVLMDLFRDHTVSGAGKAVWVIGLILFPLIGCLVYLIVRGPSMSKRAMEQAEAAQKQFDSYVRTT